MMAIKCLLVAVVVCVFAVDGRAPTIESVDDSYFIHEKRGNVWAASGSLQIAFRFDISKVKRFCESSLKGQYTGMIDRHKEIRTRTEKMVHYSCEAVRSWPDEAGANREERFIPVLAAGLLLGYAGHDVLAAVLDSKAAAEHEAATNSRLDELELSMRETLKVLRKTSIGEQVLDDRLRALENEVLIQDLSRGFAFLRSAGRLTPDIVPGDVAQKVWEEVMEFSAREGVTVAGPKDGHILYEVPASYALTNNASNLFINVKVMLPLTFASMDLYFLDTNFPLTFRHPDSATLDFLWLREKPFFALAKDRRYYARLTAADLQQCLTFNAFNHICFFPGLNKNFSQACSGVIFTRQWLQVPDICDLSGTHQPWAVQMTRRGRGTARNFLLFLNQSTEIGIDCPGKLPFRQHLERGTYNVTADDACQTATKDFVVPPKRELLFKEDVVRVLGRDELDPQAVKDIDERLSTIRARLDRDIVVSRDKDNRQLIWILTAANLIMAAVMTIAAWCALKRHCCGRRGRGQRPLASPGTSATNWQPGALEHGFSSPGMPASAFVAEVPGQPLQERPRRRRAPTAYETPNYVPTPNYAEIGPSTAEGALSPLRFNTIAGTSVGFKQARRGVVPVTHTNTLR